MKLLPELVAPWRRLTSLFDSLSSSYESIDGRVKQELSSEDAKRGENVSEHIRRLKASQHT